MTGRRFARGFTLIEMLLASTLAAVLMAGVLAATAALSRDRRRMEERAGRGHTAAITDLLRRDLTNGAAIVGVAGPARLELVCYGGVDAKALSGNQRLVRVVYRVTARGRDGGGVLVREQAYLDDPIRRERWSEVVATGVRGIGLAALSNDGEPVKLGEDVSDRLRAVDGIGGGDGPMSATRVPSRVRVRIEFLDGVVDREMVLR